MEEHREIRSSYVEYHENFMKNHTGTTAAETLLILTPIPLSVFLIGNVMLWCTYMGIHVTKMKILITLMDFILLVIPQVLSVTVLSNMCHIIVSTMLCVTISLLIALIMLNKSECEKLTINEVLLLPVRNGKRAFITNFRAQINLATAICILGVDFKVFPRRFAKTETYGFGLMDIGVGCFVIANALVSPKARKSSIKKVDCDLSKVLLKVVKSCFPLLLLGCGRFLIVNHLDYQKHVTEYGVQWNFFLTLAITKTVCELLLVFVKSEHAVVFSLFLIGVYELILSLGVRDWVLSDVPRSNFFNANREGIISCIGYMALYFAGVGIGSYLHLDRPLTKDWISAVIKLSMEAIILWMCTVFSENIFGVSRRLANAGYYFWVLAFSISLLDLFLIGEIILNATSLILKPRKRNDKKMVDSNFHDVTLVPNLFLSISYNGLFFFLLSNVFTGLINLTVYTLYKDALTSVFIICCYLFICCKIIVTFHNRKIQLKVW